MSSKFLSLTALAASLVLTGCASMAPTYERPASPVAQQWPVPQTTGEQAKAADIAWREFFTDPKLQTLISQALANNRDLRVALLNVERAQAQYGVQQADSLPTVAAGAGQTATRAPGGTITRQYTTTLGVSAYELDLFGRVKSLNDAALQRYLATDDARRSAQISLIAQVAGGYLTLAADQERLRLAEQTLLARQDGLRLTQRLQGAGVSSTLDLRQAEIAAETAQSDLASLTAQVAQDRHALELLVGQPLTAAQWPAAGTDAPVTQLAELSAGLPSDVLLTRPDVQQAERTLQAANANIGAARAAFFPRISLTASAGTASGELDGLFRSGSGLWSFMPQVSLPIFDAGRNSANLKIANVDRDIAVAQYEKAIQGAFRDVADALAARATLGQQVASQQRLVAQTQDALRLAEARFQQGLDSRLSTLDAQRTLYGAEQGLINARLAQQVNRVTLYKALGGGVQATQSAS
ncbi:efflux transporter outer membrane subunit [Roseateles asaccharophilus]|uniref:Multidrug efflux system outer membrane protein n=1 Tax=Roseateles asaccharophilus TaxID=582607 RepID=A0ABU2A4Z4_9BURK|nr:efflux transporter outer membrane subunit [Roseateles asaccharophilus]MDR7332221.1 multidrug efflux system outer membrane protein [Roseateles asaccharophilus]